ncbi:MAG: amidohydrolase family protein [Chloroflexi bacterium]|nr:amidohydrolase family protein [Chloroflexota bacterium]
MFNGTKVLDVHGHVSGPPGTVSWIDMGFASGHVGESPFRSGGNRPANLSDELMYERNKYHVDFMDDRNIDVQVIGPRPFRMMGWMPRHLLKRWCEFTNDTIHHQTQNFPDRFLSTTMLPQIAEAPDLGNCVEEFEYNIQERGFAGTYLSPDPDGRHNSPGMNDTKYWGPVYEICQKYDVPVFIHGTNCLDERIAHIPGNYQVGFVVETFLASRILAYDSKNLFSRFPGLRICIAHGGGALDRFIDSSRHRGDWEGGNLYFDTCLYDIDYLALSIRQWGPAATAFGTEAPGSGGAVRQAGDHKSDANLGRTSDDLLPIFQYYIDQGILSAEDVVDIIHNNPLKVFPQFAKV